MTSPPRQQRDTVTLELLDHHGNQLGELHPRADQPPRIEIDVTAKIPRRLTNLRLAPGDAAEIDAYEHRLRPVWTHDGADWPMGVFTFAAAARQRHGWGVELRSAVAHDLTTVLAQPLARSFVVDVDVELSGRLEALLERYGFASHRVAASAQRASSPLTWGLGRPGTTAARAIAGKLAYELWMDRTGRPIARVPPAPDVDAPDVWLEEAHVQPGVDEVDDPFLAPNTWIVINESVESSAVRGVYRLPPTNRASTQRRGYDVVRVVREAGIASTAQADRRARHAADAWQTTTTVTLTTDPLPQLDLQAIAAWRGVSYRVVAQRVDLDPAGGHQLTLRRRED